MSHDEFRVLEFASPAEAIQEAEQLANAATHTIGQYSQGQIIDHLARTLDVASGAVDPPKPPWFMRLVGPVVRGSLIRNPMKPGFKLPKKAQAAFWASEEVPLDDAMTHLRSAYRRYAEQESLPRHPFFGEMTRAQHDQFQCRHFALHLGFIVPDASS